MINAVGTLGALYMQNRDFKCNAEICYAIGQTRQTQFEEYQKTLNRFAKAVKFYTLKVDGFIGRNTVAATAAVARTFLQANLVPEQQTNARALVKLLTNPALTKETVTANIDDFLPILNNALGFLDSSGLFKTIVAAGSAAAGAVTNALAPLVPGTTTPSGGASNTTATTTTPTGTSTTTQQNLPAPTASTTTTTTSTPTPAASAADAAASDASSGKKASSNWYWWGLGAAIALGTAGGLWYFSRRRAAFPARTASMRTAGFAGMRRRARGFRMY